MARGLQIEPLDATFGAVVKGLKLTELDAAAWRDLHATWLRYALLIFPTSISVATSRSPSPRGSDLWSSRCRRSAT